VTKLPLTPRLLLLLLLLSWQLACIAGESLPRVCRAILHYWSSGDNYLFGRPTLKN
jgi:hypothetical protein